MITKGTDLHHACAWTRVLTLWFAAFSCASAGINSFSASRSSFLPGQAVVLSWDVTAGDLATITPDVGLLTTPSGSVAVLPAADTVYTLTDSTTGTTASVSVSLIKAGVLRNRWSFNEGGSGLAVIDSVGSQHGTIVQSQSGSPQATRTAETVVLPGGDPRYRAYIDLPNNLLSGLEEVTVEGWITPNGSQTWQRAFDFGSCTAGEITTRGGSFNGTSYIFLSLQNASNTGIKRFGLKHDGVENSSDPADALGTGSQFHFAYVYDIDGNFGSPQIRYYRNGMLIGSVNTAHLLANITNYNNWLGRSNWSGDSNSQAAYNEVRIWNRSLSAQRVADNAAAGPNSLPTAASIESFTAFPSTTIESGQPLRLSYVIGNPSGGGLSASIDQGVGAVSGTEGYVTVMPTATTTYTLAVTAGAVTRYSSVTVVVQPGSSPLAENLEIRVPYQTAVPVALVANDDQTSSLAYSIVSGPANGTISGTAPNLTYTPLPGFSGVDTFTYKANDGVFDSNVATVTLTVLPAPSAPVAVSLSEDEIFNDIQSGDFVGRLMTTDANPDDSFTYSLVDGVGDTHNGWFLIDKGQLIANHGFSGDLGVTVSIRLRSVDSAGLAVEQIILLPVIARPLGIVINEIHYNPSSNTHLAEYVELHNPSGVAVDVSYWRLDDAVNFLIPAGTVIPAGGYLVIAENPQVMADTYQISALGPWTGNLSSEGEEIELRDAGGLIVDRADYGSSAPWPSAADGDGPSLELVNPLQDNNLGGNWSAAVNAATPTVYLAAGSSGWKYYKGTADASSPVTAWRAEGYSDAAWLNGQAPIGLFKINSNTPSASSAETGVTLATQLTDMATYSSGTFSVSYRCVYLRKNFTVTGPIPRALSLRVMHNDAAVVYVNGVEIVRFGFPPGSPTNVPYHHTAIYESGNDPWSEHLWLNLGSVLHEGTNTIAIQGFAKSPTLRGEQEDWGAYNVFDFCVDAELKSSLATGGTPGMQNSTYSLNSAPPVRDVSHSPKAPRPWESIKVTARVSDAQGLSQVRLAYQVCLAGNYIPAILPRTVAQIMANPRGQPPSNPAFEDPANWTLVEMSDAGGSQDTAGDGVFTAVIPAQPHRTLIRYRIVATDRSGKQVTVPSTGDPRRNYAAYSYHRVPNYSNGGTVYGPGVLESLPVYQLLIRETDFGSLLAYNGADQFPNTIALATLESRRIENFPCTMVVGDQVLDHTTARLRGGNSRYMGSGKRHFRFNFAKGTWLEARDERGNVLPGRWETVLFNKQFGNKGAYDFGLPYEVGAKLWSLQGVPMPESVSIHFRVVRNSNESDPTSGDFWGLYQVLELPEGNSFLSARNLPSGNFYKTSDWMQNGEMDRRYQAKGAPAFAEDFDNIRYNIHQTTPQAEIERYVNMPLWYKYNAVQEAIRHYDIFTEPTGRHRVKNLLWYFRPQANTNGFGQLWYMPYDWDASFGPNFNNGWCNMNSAIYDRNDVPDSPTWALPKLNRDPMKIEHRNHIREFRDLLWYRDIASGRGPVDDIIDDALSSITLFYPADMARWPNNTGAVGHWAGGAPAKAQDMKNFAFTGWTDQFGSDPAVGTGGRAAYLDSISDTIDSGMLPGKPVITYSGSPGYPVDGLAFSSSSYTDPQGAGTFQAMQWRIGEITDPGAPAYQPTAPRIYEITPVWESGVLAAFQSGIAVPAGALRSGHTYRARVRHQDNSGRWGHWSAPLQFTTTVANYLATLQENLMITEIMYNPVGPAPLGGSKEDYEFIEVQNVSSSLTLDLTSVKFSKGIDFTFANGSITALPPGARAVVVKNLAAFQSRYGAGLPVAGVWDPADNLDNAGEQLRLIYSGDPIHDFVYDDKLPWPEAPDGDGASLVLIDPVSRPDHSLPGSWRASDVSNGSPGADDTGFSMWLVAQGETDPLADPDGDGINHLLMYAFGGDLVGNPREVMPVASVTTSPGGSRHLTLTYRRRIGATDVVLEPEVSPDMELWQDGTSLFEETGLPVANGDGTETVTIRMLAPVGNAACAFARLRVETVP